jgi:hypothetical protein
MAMTMKMKLEVEVEAHEANEVAANEVVAHKCKEKEVVMVAMVAMSQKEQEGQKGAEGAAEKGVGLLQFPC